MSTHESSQPKKEDHPLGCLTRMYWMMLGHVALFFSAVTIIRRGQGFALSELDAVYGASVFALILFRYLDIRYFDGKTTEYEPATMQDWRRYAVQVAIVTALIWAASHGLSHVFQRPESAS